MNDVFAFGYAGRKLPTLVQNIKDADAVLVDIRSDPHHRPTWTRRNLEEAFGDRYVWAGDTLGNVLYRTTAIQLVDGVTGMELLLSIAEKHPVALMCVCERESECHRRVIVAELEKFGLRVFHHPPPARAMTTASTESTPRVIGECSPCARRCATKGPPHDF